MNNQIDYRKRNLILWGSVPVILLLAYLLAFDKTISLFAENRVLKDKLARVSSAPREVKLLEKEAEQLQKKMRFLQEGEDLRQEVLELIDEASQSKNITLKRMKSPAVFHDDKMQIETYEIVLQGSFVPLIYAVYNIEQKLSSGRIAGARFAMEKDRTTHKEVLLSYIYIQTSRKYEAAESD